MQSCEHGTPNNQLIQASETSCRPVEMDGVPSMRKYTQNSGFADFEIVEELHLNDA